MKNPKVPYQIAAIAVSLVLLALSGWIVFHREAVALLPWSGILAGALALLLTAILEGLSARAKLALACTGAGAMAVMALLLVLPH